MTEQQPRRPLSTKVGAYRTLGQTWAASPEAEAAQKSKAEAEAAQQDLLAALKAAGFKVQAPDAGVGFTCDPETAVALAEWLRAQPPAKPRRRKW